MLTVSPSMTETSGLWVTTNMPDETAARDTKLWVSTRDESPKVGSVHLDINATSRLTKGGFRVTGPALTICFINNIL